ncbi:MAG: type II CAAX prenyl endopeptidase Rce1 family protein [Opitutales bacterium]
MGENPIQVLIYVVLAVYVLHLYRTEYRKRTATAELDTSLPGATACVGSVYAYAVIGALAILALETGGEIALGIVAVQSQVYAYSVFAALAAGVIEEVIFRGYLVVDNRGRRLLWAGCFAMSLLFALIHAHLWSFEGGFHWVLNTKSFFTTGILFVNSLWFYAIRFMPLNRERSLFPCMLAHAISNLGVYGIKGFQGFVIF